MKNKITEFLKNKIVFMFGILFFISIFLLMSVLFLVFDRSIANEKLNAYNVEISILEENKKLKENWRELENAIIEKRELIEAEKGQLELLVNNKLEIESKIQNNRNKFFEKNVK